jgi:hypothetical protein
MLHSHAHRVPDERDADLGVLRTGLSPAPVRERQYLLRNRALDENGIRTRVRRGRKKGRTIWKKGKPVRSMDASAR